MPTVRAIIRYTFYQTEEEGIKTRALITASIPGASEESALNYLIKKYPDRYNIEIIQMIIQDS